MGLLNRIFGSEKSIAKELLIDEKKRMELWQQHLNSHYDRYNAVSAVVGFFYDNEHYGDKLPDSETIKKKLKEIESEISSEFISIGEEKKTDEEIIADLNKLKSFDELQNLLKVVETARKKQKAILLLFQEIYKMLVAELHLIHSINKKISENPSNFSVIYALLRKLSTLIHNEGELCRPFHERRFKQKYITKETFEEIAWLARAVLIEAELKERVLSAEEKFAKKMVEDMESEEYYESKKRYRKLGEDIYLALAEKVVGRELPLEMGADLTEVIFKMEDLMKDDPVMQEIVKKLRPKFDDVKIKASIIAFRKAFDLGHFDELRSEFVT